MRNLLLRQGGLKADWCQKMVTYEHIKLSPLGKQLHISSCPFRLFCNISIVPILNVLLIGGGVTDIMEKMGLPHLNPIFSLTLCGDFSSSFRWKGIKVNLNQQKWYISRLGYRKFRLLRFYEFVYGPLEIITRIILLLNLRVNIIGIWYLRVIGRDWWKQHV